MSAQIPAETPEQIKDRIPCPGPSQCLVCPVERASLCWPTGLSEADVKEEAELEEYLGPALTRMAKTL